MSDTNHAADADLGRNFDPDRIESDLAEVEVALARLDAGTYWTCEITGQPLPADQLVANPTMRRLPGR